VRGCLETLMNSWIRFVGYLQRKISAEKLHNWVKSTEFYRHGWNTLFVSVPDGSYQVVA